MDQQPSLKASAVKAGPKDRKTARLLIEKVFNLLKYENTS